MFKPKHQSKGSFRARAAQAWDRMFGTPPSTRHPSPRPSSPALHSSGSPSLIRLPPVANTGESSSHPPTFPPSVTGLLVPSPSASNSRAPTPQPSTSPTVPPSSAGGTGAWNGFHVALKGLYKSSVLFPPLQLAIGGLVSCVETMDQSTKNQAEYQALALELKTLSEILDQHLQTSRSAPMSEFISRTAISIQEQVDFIASKRDRSKGRLLLEAELDEGDIIKCYNQIQLLFRRLQIDADLSTWSIANEHLANTRLENMKPVKLATYNSSLSTEINRRMCTENTRTGVLSSLNVWSEDPDTPNVYWMNGMAGTGKTTIACTFADALKKRRQLAASFFCTRTTADCRDVARIVPTIAYQLARYSTPFQSALCRVLGSDPDIGSCTVTTQFEQLLKEPLLEVKDVIPEGLVVVIDALDECTAHKGVELVLDMLFRAAADLPLKFFVTSRPEPNIRNKIQNRPNASRSVFVLHDIEQSLVQADIELYLREELAFPTRDQIQQLARLSGRLFIYAATAVRYIQIGEKFGDSKERLDNMLSIRSTTKNKHAEIDELYTAILSAVIGDKSLEEEERQRIRLVLWTTVCAREPISTETLSQLAGINHAGKAIATLQPLRSVLYVSENSNIVTTLHASFPDFMFDQTRSSTFFCDVDQHSQLLARRCFELMRDQLRFNICGLESSYTPDSLIPDLEERVTRAILPTLAYPCRYWTDHLHQASPCDELYALVQDFLSKQLLFWMEVMNLKHWMGVGVRAILTAKLWLIAHHAPHELSNFAEDASNFVTSFAANAVSQSTPHIYISALPFYHRSSVVFEHYWKRTKCLLKLTGTAVEGRHMKMLASWNLGRKVKSVAYSPDGTLLAIGLNYGSIILKRVHDGTPIGSPLEGHTANVTSVMFSLDGSRIVSGSEDYTVRLWNVQDSSLIGTPFKGHTGYVMSVAFSPDGTHIASGSYDKTVRIWNVQDGSLVGSPLEGHDGVVRSVAFSPDGSRIASASFDKTIRVWDVPNSTLIGVPLEGHTSRVRSVIFSSDGSRIVSGSDDKTIRMWNTQDGSPVGTPFEGHAESIRALAFSPDGSRIASCSRDRTIRIWDVLSGNSASEPLEGHNDYVRSVAFSPDGTRITSGSKDCTVRIWNVQRAANAGSGQKGHMASVTSVAFSADGSRIVSGSFDRTSRVWNVQQGTVVGTPFEGHTEAVASVAFSPDGSRIVSGSYDRTSRVWNVQEGTLVGTPFEGHTSHVASVAFSPDGSRIVSGSFDRTIRVWNVQNGTLVGTPFEGHTDWVRSVAFSPDGSRIVSGSDDRTIRVWNVQDGTLVGTPFEGHTRYVRSVAFSADGSRIVSGSDDRTIRVWNVQGGALVGTPFEGHTNAVRSVAFSADGSRIVSGSDDRTIRVWDVQEGTLVGTPFEGHTSHVASVVFSPDGSRIVSGSDDRTVRVWTTHENTTKIGSFSLAQDGWARNSDSQLLFWAPPDLMRIFPNPCNCWVAGQEGALQAEFSSIVIGDAWHNCYTPA